MRTLWMVLLLGGCLGDALPSGGDGGVAGDGGGIGDGGSDASQVMHADLTVEGPPTMCVSTCNRCAGGGCCGTACCNAGEWCDSQQRCRCGTNLGCTTDPICATAGAMTENQCGAICCGSSGHPCPL